MSQDALLPDACVRRLGNGACMSVCVFGILYNTVGFLSLPDFLPMSLHPAINGTFAISLAALLILPMHMALGQDTTDVGRHANEEIPRRNEFSYGIGAQFAAPAFGISGTADFTDQVSGQAVLGFWGGLQSYFGRVLYQFNEEEAYDIYGFATAGVWRYSSFGFSSSQPGFGAGVGLEYSWQHLFDSSEVPPLFGSLELGFVTLGDDLTGYNFSTISYGFGIHYRFGE